MSEQAEFWSFPTNPADFDNDDRISFSKLDKKYIAVQADGAEYEFDDRQRKWFPVADEVLMEEQQRGYGDDDDDDDDYARAGSSSHGHKRKMDSNDREDINGRAKTNKRQAVRPPQPKQNTAIYVTGLPLDVTIDEVAEHFSRKCGVIAEEIDSGRPRIKLYADAEGNFKGDALIVFFKPQSVEMAIMLLDDTDFRFTSSGLSSGKIRVQAADSSYKKSSYEGEEGTKNAPVDSSSQSQDKKAQKQRHEDKAKIIKKTQKLAAKLADWDDDEPAYADTKSGKWDKMVVLSHMFTLDELEEDPAALLDIKDDIREECAKIGEVTNVVLYDLEADGIVSVKFRTSDAAKLCVERMHGRAFDGRTVEAFFATGKEKFQRSRKDENGENQDQDDD